jgi:hypothetical protein
MTTSTATTSGPPAPIVWILSPILIAFACFCIQVGDPSKFIDYPWLWLLFRHINPYFWASIGVALALGMSIAGAAW